jgi:hypothetical protein
MFHHQITAYREFKNPEMLKSSGVFLFIKKDISIIVADLYDFIVFKKKILSIIFLQQMVYFLKWASKIL